MYEYGEKECKRDKTTQNQQLFDSILNKKRQDPIDIEQQYVKKPLTLCERKQRARSVEKNPHNNHFGDRSQTLIAFRHRIHRCQTGLDFSPSRHQRPIAQKRQKRPRDSSDGKQDQHVGVGPTQRGVCIARKSVIVDVMHLDN